jgi:hypothetical protein
MTCWAQVEKLRWSAARRRRVLERAEREQAHEIAAARRRLLHDAARSGTDERRHRAAQPARRAA